MEIQLGDLKNKAADLVKFLDEKAGIKSKVEGDKVEIEGEDLQKSQVKTYLKRFLHVNKSRKDHKVSIKGDAIKVLTLEAEEEGEEE